MYSGAVDDEGTGSIMFAVSMQPGNNYRAGVSVLEDAVNQAAQPKADSLGAGFTSGYSVPLVWSPMLTVWRKLHVEVDSMGPVDWTAAGPETSDAQSGTVQGAPTFDAQTNRAVIDTADLHGDFEDTDQHKVGRMDIMGFGAFTTLRTEVSIGDDKVTINNAPASIVNASGANYTLWDDDVGSDPNGAPPFIMVGFDAPPVVLPRVPNTSLMPSVFRDAYVDAVVMGAQYYDKSPFDRNVASQGEVLNVNDATRDLVSATDYWVVHVMSAFQGYVAKDNDPDTDEAGAGLQYGITVEQGQWPFHVHSSGALVFVETIRDKARGNLPQMTVLERYTVVHESGHQFLLQHEDGQCPPGDDEEPTGDYIMTNVLDQTGMAPNVAFGAKCLKKIRESTYPPQP